MSEKFPVRYDFVYRSEMNEICAINLYCIDREAAYDRARYDVENNRLFEEIYIEDKGEEFKIKFDFIDDLSGTVEVTNKIFKVNYSYHFDNFFDIPLGQIDHANHKVFLACYDELKALWDTDPSIKNAFLNAAKKDYDNIANFIERHCNFSEKQAEIFQKHYGDFNVLDAHIMEWCRRYFGGFFRFDFTHKDMTKSFGNDSGNNDEVPF